MSERSSDIEFDFFDEPETQEAPARTRLARTGPRRPARPPAGLTPLLRLAGLIAFAIVIVVLLVFWIQSCRDESKRSAYRDYMSSVTTIARNSDGIGRDLNTLLTTAGIQQAELEQGLQGLARRQEQGVDAAVDVDVPGRLREPHESLVDALEFRASGLRRLEEAVGQAADIRDVSEAGALLAAQAQRLVAGDVVWNDLFREPASEILRQQGIGGVEVPQSIFVRNPDLPTQRRMTSILQRIRTASTGGRPSGRHGHGLVSVTARPSGTVLRSGSDTVLEATDDLALAVVVENSGEFQEVQVKVRLTVRQAPRPITRTKTIDLIDPGEQATVVFTDLEDVVRFDQRVPLRVRVLPVRGESFTQNNSAEYPVIFTLPQ